MRQELSSFDVTISRAVYDRNDLSLKGCLIDILGHVSSIVLFTGLPYNLLKETIKGIVEDDIYIPDNIQKSTLVETFLLPLMMALGYSGVVAWQRWRNVYRQLTLLRSYVSPTESISDPGTYLTNGLLKVVPANQVLCEYFSKYCWGASQTYKACVNVRKKLPLTLVFLWDALLEIPSILVDTKILITTFTWPISVQIVSILANYKESSEDIQNFYANYGRQIYLASLLVSILTAFNSVLSLVSQIQTQFARVRDIEKVEIPPRAILWRLPGQVPLANEMNENTDVNNIFDDSSEPRIEIPSVLNMGFR